MVGRPPLADLTGALNVTFISSTRIEPNRAQYCEIVDNVVPLPLRVARRRVRLILAGS